MDFLLDAPSSSPPTAAALQQVFFRLAPALDGYPVDALLNVYVSADHDARSRAYQLVDRCLHGWISTLDAMLLSHGHLAGDESVDRILARQVGARDALVCLKVALSRLEVVQRPRGQLC